MLKLIRDLKFGWIIIFMAIIMIASGLSMILSFKNGTTWLCQGEGCKLVQGYSLLGMSIFMIIIGAINIAKR